MHVDSAFSLPTICRAISDPSLSFVVAKHSLKRISLFGVTLPTIKLQPVAFHPGVFLPHLGTRRFLTKDNDSEVQRRLPATAPKYDFFHTLSMPSGTM
jgi:hypothetical protein